ncbi:hypothetical protein ABC345_14355 [Shouchella sp. 1P09AA]|uniref:hypothetical protein n=1 Tax=unclassified Shouchella TaxID=2893065 RepID=UPI0039A048B6
MKRLSIGIGVGVLIGVLASRACQSDEMKPETVLKKVKAVVKQEYIIHGSWIHMQPETITHLGLTYQAYRGGLTSSTVDGPVQYEFVADINSGVLLKLEQI